MSNLELSRAQRLDQEVVALMPTLSRAFAAKLIQQGNVQVNGAVELKAGYKLRPADVVTVDYDDQAELAIPTIDLEVLYEDADCVVINKPVGTLTHSKGAFNPEASVATWLRQRLATEVWEGTTDQSGNARAGIVHRLDRATSGVMICAKTPAALSWLQKQFSQRRAKKTYMAIVSGELAEPQATIDMPIERNPKKPQTFRVGSNGRSAVTDYVVTDTNESCSLLTLRPTTGRTHQLRVHLAHLGHPIVGDTFYGGLPADRLYLHAANLEITLPDHQRHSFSAPLPELFATYMRGA